MFLFTSLSSATTQTTSGSGRDSNSVHSLAKCFYLLHSVAPPHKQRLAVAEARTQFIHLLNVSIYFLSSTTQTTSGSGRDSNSVHSLAKCFYLLHSVAETRTQTTSGSGRDSNSVHSLAKCFYLLHSVAPHKQRLAVAETRTQFIHLLNVSIYFTQ